MRSWFVISLAWLSCLLSAQVTQAERFIIASDFRVELPPLFWRDHCSGEYRGFGWRIQQRLWQDLGLETEHFQINMHSEDSLSRLSKLMQEGKVDAYLTMPPLESDALTTTDEPFFWLPDSIYQRKDSTWQYQRWADLKGKRGVMVLPVKSYDRRSKKFRAYSEEFLDLSLVSSYIEGFRQLNEGKIDYLITYRLIGSTFIDLYDLGEVKATPIQHIAQPTYMAIAKHSELNDKRKEIDGLLAQYREGSVATLLLKSSLQEWVTDVKAPKSCPEEPSRRAAQKSSKE